MTTGRTEERVPGARRTRGLQPLRDLPVVLWLTGVVVVAVVHPWVAAPRWLLLHLLLLGALSHAIHVWSQHFTDALLHSSPAPRAARHRTTRLAFHNGGTLAVVSGVLLESWPVTVAGATLVATAAGWHGAALLGQLRRAMPARFATTVHCYVAAAAILPVGAALGTALAWGLPGALHERVLLAHVLLNVLGWVGLTVLGTLLTLWPTMLRTRMADGAEQASRRALPVLICAVLLAAGGALAGALPVVSLGLAGYLLGIAALAGPFVDAARRKPPRTYATWSVLAGAGWLVALLGVLAVALATAGGTGGGTGEGTGAGSGAADRLAWAVPFLACGFGAQLLLGASSYLVPVAVGGGPAAVRAATAVLDRGSALRVTTANLGLLVLALPTPSSVRVVASLAVLAALAAFLPLVVLAVRASSRVKRASAAPPRPPAAGLPAERPPGQLRGLAATGLAVVVLGVAVGVALDPLALTGTGGTAAGADAGATPTGRTTTVEVEAGDMRFTPGTVTVPAGDRLVIEVVNLDEDVHDLVLDTGDRTGRLAPGESATLEVGVVGRALDGWCSVVGHRQMGMVLQIAVEGRPDRGALATHAPAGAHAAPNRGEAAAEGAPTPPIDVMAPPGETYEPVDASLPPLSEDQVRRVTLTVREVVREVAPGVTQRLWTYDGTAPGPLLHGRVGDTFEVTLVNDGSLGHSVDFHAGALAPDGPMRTIAPGERLVYRFTAERAGIWMYHCSTMPMSAHIANGMFGAVVIEPPDLPPVDRSYVLVQSELYLGADGSSVDVDKLRAEEPDAVVFNGHATHHAATPLPARVGERVRLWVLDAGPNRSSSFHVVGGQFDTVWAEGAFLLERGAGGSQALALAPAQGGFVELVFPEAGTYPFVSHAMVDAERGARGLFTVRRPDR